MSKPRIRKMQGGLYVCIGAGRHATGSTPEIAYRNWDCMAKPGGVLRQFHNFLTGRWS